MSYFDSGNSDIYAAGDVKAGSFTYIPLDDFMIVFLHLFLEINLET
ncbi:MAG: hypothetical protein SPI03_08625 [Campylobacter sputorum]|nr:hypothetical protein [Campylobacter sputorum]MDY6121376.1 hypothetical protein [Campylobacter sputorum]